MRMYVIQTGTKLGWNQLEPALGHYILLEPQSIHSARYLQEEDLQLKPAPFEKVLQPKPRYLSGLALVTSAGVSFRPRGVHTFSLHCK